MKQAEKRASRSKRRFDRIRGYLEKVTSWAFIPRKSSTLIIDLGVLDETCSLIRKMLDELMRIPPIEANADKLATQVANLWAQTDHLKAICRDLNRPLDRLLSSLGERTPDDEEDG